VLDIGSAKVDWCVITQAITKKHKEDLNTRYRDSAHFEDGISLGKGVRKGYTKNF
jgi:hypothetical protein